jgi:hypothetical protein
MRAVEQSPCAAGQHGRGAYDVRDDDLQASAVEENTPDDGAEAGGFGTDEPHTLVMMPKVPRIRRRGRPDRRVRIRMARVLSPT